MRRINKHNGIRLSENRFWLPKNQSNVIKVIGVGGGSNAVNYMYHWASKG